MLKSSDAGSPAASISSPLTEQAISAEVRRLGPWFHNLDLGGVRTAPDHFLGDYPTCKWRGFAGAIPADLTGKTVLDLGCNAGFYAIEMKRRGAARVVGVDCDDEYLAQARFAASVSGAEIELVNLSVYDVARLGERFDLVLFLGVLYHLRHPLLALDLLREHVVGETLVVQSLLRGDESAPPVAEDYPFAERQIFEQPGYPRMCFVEERYAGDPTNWWIPNRACLAAMIRSAGFRITAHPEPEVFVCELGRADGQGDEA
jgi:tRNA (mo5U34)-methyltransferase